jgi:hypothetical protein
MHGRLVVTKGGNMPKIIGQTNFCTKELSKWLFDHMWPQLVARKFRGQFAARNLFSVPHFL